MELVEFTLLISNVIKLVLEIELKRRNLLDRLEKEVNFSLDFSI